MLRTEERNPRTMNIDRCSTLEMMEMIQRENEEAAHAVREAIEDISCACDAIAERMREGGRLFYIGAGTSGRLGVLDAAECPPTYGISPDTVIGIIAGGEQCMFRASENREDIGAAGVRDLAAYQPTEKDSVVGISAAGGASYVIEALQYANTLGCLTIAMTNNHGTPLEKVANMAIVTDTGPEVVTGSTRMKAGSAQKMVLNMLSTGVMIKMGYVYENLLVNMRPSNKKLYVRAASFVCNILKCTEEEAYAALEANNWSIRAALDSLQGGSGK